MSNSDCQECRRRCYELYENEKDTKKRQDLRNDCINKTCSDKCNKGFGKYVYK